MYVGGNFLFVRCLLYIENYFRFETSALPMAWRSSKYYSRGKDVLKIYYMETLFCYSGVNLHIK